MQPQAILDHLAEHEAVLTGMHFVYTNGNHGPAYINMRAVAHQKQFRKALGVDLANALRHLNADIVVGPETLGRSLADDTADALGVVVAWCDMCEDNQLKWAEFSTKLNFARLLPGMRVVIVDDLLTTGGSIRLTAEAVTEAGGIVVGAAAVVRRTPDVGVVACGVPELFVLAEVEGFELFTESECAERGPCSRLVPMVLRPGHGWKWAENHPDYPTA